MGREIPTYPTERLDNGYRIYSDKDINTLLTVKALAEQGHSIKQAAILVKTENVSIDVKTFSKSELTFKTMKK